MKGLILGTDIATRGAVQIQPKLRYRHLYVLGKSGVGKSTFLHRLVHQDAKHGHAVIVFDAGDLARGVIESLPQTVIESGRVHWFSVESPIAYNPLALRRGQPERLENELFSVMDQVTVEGSSTAPLSARMKALLGAALRAVLKEENEPTLSSVVTCLSAKKTALRTGLGLREDEFASTWEAVRDRLRPFLRDPRIRRIICRPNELDFRKVIDEGQILIISLAGLEPGVKRFVGTLLFNALQSVVFERSEEERRDVSAYVDEFHDYVASSISAGMFQQIFNQGRKFRLSFAVAHTDLEGVDRSLLGTIHSTAASLVAFQCGAPEARRMSEIFAGQHQPGALQLLPDYDAVARVGTAVHPMHALPPLAKLRKLAQPRWDGIDPPDPFDEPIRDHDDRKPIRPTIRKKAPATPRTPAPEGNPA